MKYEHIDTLWKRDMEGKFGQKGKIIEGDFSKEEFGIIDQWEVTEKIDGMNIRIEIKPDDINGVFVYSLYGRTDKAIIPEQLKNNLIEHFDNIDLLKIFDMSKANCITLFGEGFGHKIQEGGKYISDNQNFILFDINIDGIWLESEKVTEFTNKLKLLRVPIIGIMTKKEVIEYVKSKPKSAFGDFVMEGVVCRTKPLLLRRMGERVIFKLKDRDFI